MNQTNYSAYLKYENEQQRKYQETLKEFGLLKHSSDNPWIYSVSPNIEVKRGFKIHLSATIVNATAIAESFFKFIKTNNFDINFKILSSLKELTLQNAGIYGYSQVGKFITIYPNSDDELNRLLVELEMLFKGVKGIPIPSDFKFQLSDVVYYRYGEFIKDPSYRDMRNKTIPADVKVPISDYYIDRYDNIPSEYLILKVLIRNAKGGVYKVFNIHSKQVVILKESKNLSMIDFTNRDSVNRMIMEKEILVKLKNEKFSPRFIREFYVKDSYFIEIDYIDGKSLKDYKFIREDFNWFESLIDIFEILNIKYNITYRDISFDNIIIDDNNKISIIDFEHSINKSTYVLEDKISLFGTPGFYETNLNISGNQPEDVTGLVYLLYWSQFPKRFKEFMKLDYKDAIRYTIEFEKSRLDCVNTDNMFFGIFKKSFKHEYNSFSELREDFISVISNIGEI
ncbi:protein kinase domain-containing protein [Streptococcus salivarius]|uniref:class III lanthionine synthetase LanKC N-terminal domain-containing protein n=1 Tax=Streptococcus salivarius TaxID=1304 RepID=UPI0022E06F46|nr:protein kinase [Streptococcus salivarius]